jgi:hypothetical protein
MEGRSKSRNHSHEKLLFKTKTVRVSDEGGNTSQQAWVMIIFKLFQQTADVSIYRKT